MTLLAGCYQETGPRGYVPKTAAAEKNAQAVAAWRAGDLEGALAQADAAAAADPNFAQAHVNRGVLLGKLGRLDEAIAALEAAVTLDSRLPLAHLYLGLFLEKTGRAGEAKDHYAAAFDGFRAEGPGLVPPQDFKLKLAVVAYLHQGRIAGEKAINNLITEYPTYGAARRVRKELADGNRAFFFEWLTLPGGFAAPPPQT